MQRFTALLLCAVLGVPACAARSAQNIQSTPSVATPPMSPMQDRAVLTDYARQIQYGTRVQVTTTGNRRLRGTLIKTTDTGIVLMPRGRIPEPPIEISFQELAFLEPERHKAGIGKAIAIGAATGAAGALGVLMILFAVYSD